MSVAVHRTVSVDSQSKHLPLEIEQASRYTWKMVHCCRERVEGALGCKIGCDRVRSVTSPALAGQTSRFVMQVCLQLRAGSAGMKLELSGYRTRSSIEGFCWSFLPVCH